MRSYSSSPSGTLRLAAISPLCKIAAPPAPTRAPRPTQHPFVQYKNKAETKGQKTPKITTANYTYIISTAALLQMHSKAKRAQVTSRVTYAIVYGIGTANGAWVANVEHLRYTLNVHVFGFHFPSFFPCFVSTCTGALLLGRRGGDAAMTPLSCIFFVIICIANFRRKVNVGSGFSSLARA